MSAIINDRDNILQSGGPRLIATTVTISGTGAFFNKGKNGAAVTPTDITLTANPTVFTSPTYSWEYALGTSPSSWVSLGSGSTKTISGSSVDSLLSSTSGAIYYRVSASQSGYLPSTSPTFTISFSREADEPVVVNISRANALVSVDALGVLSTVPAPNTDTTVTVTRGGVPLNYGATGANTFSVSYSVTSGSVTYGSVTLSGTTAVYGNITAMSTDTATVLFTVSVRDAQGNTLAQTFTVTEFFVKLKPPSTYTFQLKPPSVTVLVNPDGSIVSLANAFTLYEIFKGAVADHAAWTFSKVDVNVTSTLVSNVCTITDVDITPGADPNLVGYIKGTEGTTFPVADSSTKGTIDSEFGITINTSTTGCPITGGTYYIIIR